MPYGPATNKPMEIGELTHLDLWGKYDTASINGNCYFVLIIDDSSRHITMQSIKKKSHVAQQVIDYLAYLKARHRTPLDIHVNHSSEFINETLSKYTSAQGIKLNMTALHSPVQNGVTECMNCTLVELRAPC
jgi:hypothetical protein